MGTESPKHFFSPLRSCIHIVPVYKNPTCSKSAFATNCEHEIQWHNINLVIFASSGQNVSPFTAHARCVIRSPGFLPCINCNRYLSDLHMFFRSYICDCALLCARVSVGICFCFRCLCARCVQLCARVNKCTDGTRVARAGKAAVGVAATLCLSFRERCKGSVTWHEDN